MILIRTTRIDARLEEFADTLVAASGERVAMLVDERRGSCGETRHGKVSLTDAACAALGLYTPADFAWRCGDYGFYLAQSLFPDEAFFWIVDFDVRIGGDARLFFEACAARPDIDLLAAHVAPTDGGWWWYATVQSRDATPYRCFFPLVRLSARAVRQLGDTRRAQSRRPLRRALWPNDEAFVATAAHHAGLTLADLNGLGQTFYDDATFSYLDIIKGEDFDDRGMGAPRLYHPVLFGEDYRKKMERTQRDHGAPTRLGERLRRRLFRQLNGLTRW